VQAIRAICRTCHFPPSQRTIRQQGKAVLPASRTFLSNEVTLERTGHGKLHQVFSVPIGYHDLCDFLGSPRNQTWRLNDNLPTRKERQMQTYYSAQDGSKAILIIQIDQKAKIARGLLNISTRTRERADIFARCKRRMLLRNSQKKKKKKRRIPETFGIV
jgi:hypothetical protein